MRTRYTILLPPCLLLSLSFRISHTMDVVLLLGRLETRLKNTMFKIALLGHPCHYPDVSVGSVGMGSLEVVRLPQRPTVTLKERSKRRNLGHFTPNFGIFQWIPRHFLLFWRTVDRKYRFFKNIRIRQSNMKSSLSGSTCILLTAKSSTVT